MDQQAQKPDIVIIDGSSNEGGGQIFRMSLALSIILRQKFKIINIRASRPNPGINNQLKSVIDLMKQLTQANVEGDKMGSQEIYFEPLEQQVKGGKFECGGKTAQSVTLMLQCLLPVFIFAKEPTQLTLKGGTIVSKSPPSVSISNLLMGLLRRMGMEVQFNVLKDGYFPGGGGIMKVEIKPCQNLAAIELLDGKAKVNEARLLFLLTKELPIKDYAKDFKETISKVDSSRTNSEPDFQYQHDLKVIQCKKFKECYGVIAHIKAEPNVFDCSLICMDDEPLERVFLKVMKRVVFELNQEGNCLDEYHQDQLLIFMALAKGVSRVDIGKHLTEHTQAALYVLKSFIPELQYEVKQGECLRLLLTGINFNPNKN